MKRRDRLDLLALARQAEEAAEQLEVAGRSGDALDDLRQAGDRQEVGKGAVGLLDRQAQHSPRSAARTIGIGWAGGASSLKPFGARSPVSAT